MILISELADCAGDEDEIDAVNEHLKIAEEKLKSLMSKKTLPSKSSLWNRYIKWLFSDVLFKLVLPFQTKLEIKIKPFRASSKVLLSLKSVILSLKNLNTTQLIRQLFQLIDQLIN